MMHHENYLHGLGPRYLFFAASCKGRRPPAYELFGLLLGPKPTTDHGTGYKTAYCKCPYKGIMQDLPSCVLLLVYLNEISLDGLGLFPHARNQGYSLDVFGSFLTDNTKQIPKYDALHLIITTFLCVKSFDTMSERKFCVVELSTNLHEQPVII